MSSNSDITLPSKAVWVSPVKKGKSNRRILLDPLGFRMHYKKTDYNKKYFHCAHKDDKKCPVKVSLDVSSDMITGWRGDHNHDNELIENNVKKIVREKVLNAAENPSISPRTVMQDITNAVLSSGSSSAGLPYVPNIKTLAKNVQRSRTKVNKHPAIPHNWEDMEIPMEMQETVDKKPFCVMKENLPRSEQLIWGFASESAMQVMKTSTDWYIDGTFELVNSTLFKQVWVIVCPINNYSTSIPCAFFLLPCKEYTAYKMVMDCISSNDIPSPEKIHLDFEAGAIKAVKDVYPTTNLIGCDVHWKRCLREKLKQLGLLKYTNQFEDVQVFVRKLWSLSIVPPNKVISVWEEFIKDSVPYIDEEQTEDSEDKAEAVTYNAALEQFVVYFESTWLGSKNARNPEGPRRKARFDMGLWNKYDQVINEDDGCNNKSESWNSVSKIGLNMHPSIWVVLDLFKREEGLARAKLSSVALGTAAVDHPARAKARAEKRRQLKEVAGQFGTTLMEDYLNMVVAHYNDH